MSEGQTPADLNVPNYAGSYLEFLGFRVVEMRPGFVRLRMPLNRQHTNTLSMAHGGVVMSILDIAGAFSAQGDDGAAVGSITISQSTNFVRAVTGSVLVAEGQVVRRTRSMAFTQSVVLDPSLSDERDEQICATAQCTYKISKRN